ncbi:MAG: zinc-finger domain-containing protein [Lautropia sp.]|nr:zinc-finger domain-containing protein [Lautropia sp.]
MNQSALHTAPVELDAADLPAFCPNPEMTLWNQHPRVFLDVTRNGSARCPYCNTVYRLKPGVELGRGH